MINPQNEMRSRNEGLSEWQIEIGMSMCGRGPGNGCHFHAVLVTENVVGSHVYETITLYDLVPA